MTLKGDAKFQGKLTRGLKNDIRTFSWYEKKLTTENIVFITKEQPIQQEEKKKTKFSKKLG